MEDGLTRTTPDKAKAGSILKMARTTLEMVKNIDERRFASNMVKEYYDIIRLLISAVLVLDGLKTYGEGAHKKAIEYLNRNFREFTEFDITLINDLRITRNRISYNGFFVTEEFFSKRKGAIHQIIRKLENIIEQKL